MSNDNENSYDPYVYVITEKGWEYNDSNYYSVGNYGRPSEAFIIEKLALEYCDEINFKWFLDHLGEVENVSHYTEEFDVHYSEELINGIEHLKWDDKNYLFKSEEPNRLNKEKILNLMENLAVIQYEVVRVKLRG